MIDFAIIDAHHHVWDLSANYLPWLSDPEDVPFRYGSYAPLRRNYMVADYRRDAGGYLLAGSVFVETEWDPADPLGEQAWLERVASDDGIVPTVSVAQAVLDRQDIETVLNGYARFPRVRGVRHKPRSAPTPDRVERGARGSMGDPAWRRGFSLLAERGLSLDLQIPYWHLREARDLADAFPETTIILNHTGLPADRAAEGLAGWGSAMRTLAGAPNAQLKISGLGQPDRAWTLEANGPIIREAIEIFGPGRVMFASNFPVDGLVANFTTIFQGFDAATLDYSAAERLAMFRDNANRIYRMNIATTD